MSRTACGLRKLRGEATCLAIAFIAGSSCSDAGNGARTSEPRAPDRWSIDKAGGNGDQRDTVLSTIAQLAVLVQVNDRPGGAATVTWRVLRDTAVVTTSPTSTDPAGMATFQFVLGPTAGNYTVEASLDSAVSSGARVTFSIVATPGNATTLAIQSGADQTDTATAQLQADYVVRLSDGHGNGVPGTVVSWAVTSGGGSMSPTTTLTTAPNGEARARRQLGSEVGPSSAIAAALGLDAPVVFNAIAVSAHPTRLTMVSGNNQVALINNALGADDIVRVSDSYGNGVGGVAIDWTIVGGGGSLSTTRSTTLADGSATVRSTLGSAAGTQTIAATAADLPSAPRVTFSATALGVPPPPAPPSAPPPPPPPPPAGPATTLVLVSGDGQTGSIGTPLPNPVVAQARDAGGHGVPGQLISFTASGSGAAVPASVVTDNEGNALTSWTLGGSAGPQTLTVTPNFNSAPLSVHATAILTPLAIVGDPSYYFYGLSQSIGIGQYATAWVGPSDFRVLAAPLTVSFASKTSRLSVPASVTIPTGGTFMGFRIVGTSAGTDSLTASAAGYTSASLEFVVGLGLIDFGLTGYPVSSLKAGGTNGVYLCSYGPQGEFNLLASATTFSLASSSNVSFSTAAAPATPITAATIPADDYCTNFVIHGLGAGTATITISSPNFTTLVTSLTVKP